MIYYFFKRLFLSFLTLLILLTITFFSLRLAPGGPFDSEHSLPPEVIANLEAKYHLSEPLPLQYLSWVGDFLRGDLKESFQFIGQPVSELIGQAIGPSACLGSIALILALVLGVAAGTIAAWKQNSWIDWSSMFLSVSGMSLPSYVVAVALVLLFSLKLQWLPPALWEDWSSMILPVITLSLRPMAMIARLTRSSVLDALGADFVRTAHAKGAGPIRVVFKHALKNALVPVLSLVGPLAAQLVTGSFVVELVFQIPGLGKYFVSAVINRDYPLVMGVTYVFGALLIACNWIVDLLYAQIDPRIAGDMQDH